MDRRLHQAIIQGDFPAFASLIEEDNTIIKQTVAFTLDTALHLAARFGHLELASKMVDLCSEMVLSKNKISDTPLHEASRQGHVAIVRLLLKIDDRVAHEVNADKESALLVACKSGKLDVVKELLHHRPWMLRLDWKASTTSLHAATESGYEDIVREILIARPDLASKKDLKGRTPLPLACIHGDLKIAQELLMLPSASDLSCSEDSCGNTPLLCAAISGRVNIIDMILYSKPELAEKRTVHGKTILHLAVMHNQYEAIKCLIETHHLIHLVNFPDEKGNTILHIATTEKFNDIIIYLLKLETDVNARNHKGETALDMVESEASNSEAIMEIITVLEEAGAKRSSDKLQPGSPKREQIPEAPLENGNDRAKFLTCSSFETSLFETFENEDEIRMFQPVKNEDDPKSQTQCDDDDHQDEKEVELEIQGLRNARNKVTIVAVLVASLTFAAGISPPGGFNQETGKAMMGRQTSFKIFMVCNILALFLSFAIVVVFVGVIPFRQSSTIMRMLEISHYVMWGSISFVMAAFISAVWTIMPHGPGFNWVLVVLVSTGVGMATIFFMCWVAMQAKPYLRKSHSTVALKKKKRSSMRFILFLMRKKVAHTKTRPRHSKYGSVLI